MKRIAYFGLALTLLANEAVAYTWARDWSPAAIGSMRVSIADGATDGCWTNLGESKTYAEDKLRNLGFTVVDSGTVSNIFNISIGVDSHRLGKTCYGEVEITIFSTVTHNGIWGIHEIATAGEIFTGYENANMIVLDVVKTLIDEIAEKQN